MTKWRRGKGVADRRKSQRKAPQVMCSESQAVARRPLWLQQSEWKREEQEIISEGPDPVGLDGLFYSESHGKPLDFLERRMWVLTKRGVGDNLKVWTSAIGKSGDLQRKQV